LDSDLLRVEVGVKAAQIFMFRTGHLVRLFRDKSRPISKRPFHEFGLFRNDQSTITGTYKK